MPNDLIPTPRTPPEPPTGISRALGTYYIPDERRSRYKIRVTESGAASVWRCWDFYIFQIWFCTLEYVTEQEAKDYIKALTTKPRELHYDQYGERI